MLKNKKEVFFLILVHFLDPPTLFFFKISPTCIVLSESTANKTVSSLTWCCTLGDEKWFRIEIHKFRFPALCLFSLSGTLPVEACQLPATGLGLVGNKLGRPVHVTSFRSPVFLFFLFILVFAHFPVGYFSGQPTTALLTAVAWALCCGQAVGSSQGERWLYRYCREMWEWEQLPAEVLIKGLMKLPPKLTVTTKHSPADRIAKVLSSCLFTWLNHWYDALLALRKALVVGWRQPQHCWQGSSWLSKVENSSGRCRTHYLHSYRWY